MENNQIQNKSSWLTNGLLIVEILAMIGIFMNIQGQIQSQSDRSNRLYEMFVTNQKEFKDEMKDIHGRICGIEERNRK